MSIICPYCLSELHERAAACPHCGGVFAGRNPAGSLPVGTVLGGRYTVGEIERIDGEGILYRGAENVGRFRVTIKEYMPLTLAAERGMDATLRPKLGSEVLFKTTRMDFADLYRSIQRITPANGLEAVLDVFEENNTVYAVMENPGGVPLGRWLDQHPGPLPSEQVCAMLHKAVKQSATDKKSILFISRYYQRFTIQPPLNARSPSWPRNHIRGTRHPGRCSSCTCRVSP